VTWSQEKTKTFASLNLVDLAGSEGMKKTGATGKALKEGIKINLSLTKLALVVKCLAEGSQHVPFRESKLTMMLQKGLGGNNMLHIILALSNSAEHVSESTACLRFGQSCLSMTVDAKANAVEKEQAEMKAVIQEQMKEITDLASENEELKRLFEEMKAKSVRAASRLSTRARPRLRRKKAHRVTGSLSGCDHAENSPSLIAPLLAAPACPPPGFRARRVR